MNIQKLETIGKLYFTTNDISRALGVTLKSANVSASRYCAKGYIIRVKRGLYVLKNKWNTLGEKDLYSLANILQVPSYISLGTALSYYGISTQLQQGYIESIALKRTKTVNLIDTSFNYIRISKKLYSGFTREKDFFIALPEKAFLDSLYLSLMGKYSFDISAIDKGKMERENLKRLWTLFPKKVRREAEKWIS
ncbi:MAG: type IV toxin-antitoxin system AbiEi family antitoxin domain-containing protein [Candidatus Tantalella remota]|nr:type IV toxin-antitoxin system AbiEi family antitoxin domain-containing protein [Candidatus Tantalella remota]